MISIGGSDIVKAKSSGEDPIATGGLVSNLPHSLANKTKKHNISSLIFHRTGCALLLHTIRMRSQWLGGDDDCFYYHSWRNNVVISFGTLSSFFA